MIPGQNPDIRPRQRPSCQKLPGQKIQMILDSDSEKFEFNI